MTGLLRIFVVFLVVMAVLSFLRGIGAPARKKAAAAAPGGETRGPARTGKLFKDPVCGTYVTSGGSPTTKHGGEPVYFCSEECLNKFLATSS